MDIKSIVRAFRYGQLQSKAEHDPEAKQPPTIKFMAIALFVGVVALGFGLLVLNYEPTGDSIAPLSEPDTTPPANNTTIPTTPTPDPNASQAQGPLPQQGPETRRDEP